MQPPATEHNPADRVHPIPTHTSSHLDVKDRLIVALDVPSADAALDLVKRLEGTCRWFKVGMELYYAAGNSIVSRLVDLGHKVFLDLKLHDIPNTVAGAVRSVSTTGASLLTIHAGGGEQMMRAAAQAASSPHSPELLAVTVLTSMGTDDLVGIGVQASPADQVLRLAQLAQASGITGLVCSPEEVAAVRQAVGPAARLVVPGIRPSNLSRTDDQRRVATAAETIARGASMLVVGRPITQAQDPAEAASLIIEEIRASS